MYRARAMSSGSSRLVLVAMIFAVAMTFIDQTIVALAIPELQKDLSLSATGTQWIVNAYLLSLSALFAFGGRLADVAGHRRMVVIGVVVFATASALCGATPTGDAAEAWMIVFRVLQGAGAALMFPAALAIVVGAFPQEARGRAMATFFGVTGALTAVGPMAGGYLTEWTWRAIFWVNVPVAIIALVLTHRARPADDRRPSPLDWPGVGLVAAGMGLAVLGLQQSSAWGWGDPVTWACIVAGLLLLVAFVLRQLRVEHPLMRMQIFRDRGFAADNAVLFLLMIVFVPLFLFASLYAQISLGEDASGAGLYLLIFFGGYWAGAQWGGRQLDSRGVRAAVIPGCALAAVGFFLWGESLTDLDGGDHWIYMVMAGAGTGAILGPASTDALNRAPSTSYGEATGILQTLRNFGSSLGLAVLGTILILENKANIESSLTGLGIPTERADAIADSLSQSGGGGGGAGFGEAAGRGAQRVLEAVRHDFAESTQVIFYVMAGALVACYLVAHLFLPKGKPAVEASPAGSPESSASAATGS
jgi:EmrB/QacA subfamily drug resistance transporter